MYPLSAKAVELFLDGMKIVSLAKGAILFKEGAISSKIYFLEKGAVRALYYKEDKEITFWFGFEGEMIMTLHSYIANKPGYETIELLEESLLYEMDLNYLQDLYKENIELANWGRKMAEEEFLKAEKRFLSQQFQTAREKYESLQMQYPRITERVQLGYIASYLGINQVTLSRIRSDLRNS
ncbi:cyclic nucleotide-binding protein [Sporocytophaga myxococcoides]|uniref:Cyclic nucleotide-binding protein n=1 Tax=Sporocytophaga myxococcoides TaxID=153721 RepID=A0A098L9C1_9BACT|nr:cyclic nucleotide-binding protein [Sporocytophaga myxococcoides]